MRRDARRGQGGRARRIAECRPAPAPAASVLCRPVPSRARRARPRPAPGSRVLRGARCRARGSKDGGLRAILGAAGLCAAGRLRVGHPLPGLGLPLPRGAELGRKPGGIQLAPRPHHHGLRLHPGHRCVGGPGGRGAAGERGLPGAAVARPGLRRGRLRGGPWLVAGHSGSSTRSAA